jgi:hypothetical protein
MAITKKQTQEQTQEQGQIAGLCATCLHSRKITSAHDSVFFLCQLGFSDERFPKYPRLPVLTCAGFTPSNASNSEAI